MTNNLLKSLRILALVLVLGAGTLLESCNPCGRSSGPAYFRVTDLEIWPVDGGAQRVHTFTDVIAFYTRTVKEYFSESQTTRWALPSFFGTAYACSPAESRNYNEYSEFRFSVDTDFVLLGDTISAGTNLIQDPRTVGYIEYPNLNYDWGDNLIFVGWDSSMVDFPPGVHMFRFSWVGATQTLSDSAAAVVDL